MLDGLSLDASDAHLLLAETFHFFARGIGIGFAHPGIKQTHEVVNLGNGTYGTAWILIGGLLFYGDHR